MKKILYFLLTFAMLVSIMIVPAGAVDTGYPLPDPLLPEQFTDDVYDWFLVQSGWDHYVYAYKKFNVHEPCDVRFVYKSADDAVFAEASVNMDLYYCHNWQAGGWGVIYPNGCSYRETRNLNGMTIVASSQPIYNEDGTVFFPEAPSLMETVEDLTMEQTMRVQQGTVGVMKILVPCGVGCLALLMALPLLSKKFKIFLH